jgi:hypothetical protein
VNLKKGLEGDGKDLGGWVGIGGGVFEDVEAAGVFEDGEVEVDGFFSVVVEPEKGCDARKVLERAH